MLPKDLAKLVPKNHLMAEAEWRGIGVQQSQGWIHYMIHQPGKPARFSLPDTLSDRRFFSPNQSRTFYCSAGPSPHPPPSKTSRERMKQRLGSANSKCCLDNYLHWLFCSFCPSFHLSFPFSSKKKKKKKNLLSSFMSCRGFSVLLRHTIRTKLYNMPCVVIKCCALFCEYMKKLFQTWKLLPSGVVYHYLTVTTATTNNNVSFKGFPQCWRDHRKVNIQQQPANGAANSSTWTGNLLIIVIIMIMMIMLLFQVRTAVRAFAQRPRKCATHFPAAQPHRPNRFVVDGPASAQSAQSLRQ